MKAKFVKLRECADVLPGLSIKTRLEHDPRGTHWVILPRHVSQGVDLRYFPDEVMIDEDIKVDAGLSAGKYMLRQGDVIIIARGVNNFPVYVESVPENTVAANMFLIIRPKKYVLGKYLAWCLGQRSLQGALAQVRTHAATPMIQRPEFEQLVVPLPSIEDQKKVASLADLMLRERELIEKLNKETARLQELAGEIILQKMQEGD